MTTLHQPWRSVRPKRFLMLTLYTPSILRDSLNIKDPAISCYRESRSIWWSVNSTFPIYIIYVYAAEYIHRCQCHMHSESAPSLNVYNLVPLWDNASDHLVLWGLVMNHIVLATIPNTHTHSLSHIKAQTLLTAYLFCWLIILCVITWYCNIFFIKLYYHLHVILYTAQTQ